MLTWDHCNTYLPEIIVSIVFFLDLLALHSIDEHRGVIVKPSDYYHYDDDKYNVTRIIWNTIRNNNDGDDRWTLGRGRRAWSTEDRLETEDHMR